MTYNLSKQGKHLRRLTTASSLGLEGLRTKTLMVCILVVKLTAIIFCKTKCKYKNSSMHIRMSNAIDEGCCYLKN